MVWKGGWGGKRERVGIGKTKWEKKEKGLACYKEGVACGRVECGMRERKQAKGTWHMREGGISG